jgi:hypothetical protein
MTPAERRLLALSVLFAPSAAGRLLRRLAAPGSEAIADAAALLANRPRAERLAALAESLAPVRLPGEVQGLLAAALSAERAAVACALRDRIPPELRPPGRPPRPTRAPASSLLRRACLELVAGLAAPG